MATMVGKQADIGKALNAALELEYDAIGAYEAAVSRLESRTSKEQLKSFLADHEGHVEELTRAIAGLGLTPATRGDAKGILAKGKVVVGGLFGDHAILLAMKTNEDDTNTAYERLLQRSDFPAGLLSLAQRFLGDERRHRAWIEDQLRTTPTKGSSASTGGASQSSPTR